MFRFICIIFSRSCVHLPHLANQAKLDSFSLMKPRDRTTLAMGGLLRSLAGFAAQEAPLVQT